MYQLSDQDQRAMTAFLKDLIRTLATELHASAEIEFGEHKLVDAFADGR